MPTSFFDSDLDAFFAQLERHNRERVLAPPPAGALDLCSNDYLGLSQHPQIIAALHEGLERYGAGSTASRLVRGHRDVFAALEAAAAEWLGGEEALYFANGYAANVGVISAVCDGSYAAFIDRLAHASLTDGVRLSGADKIYFRHNDMEHLRQLLTKSGAKKRIIISESVFSMDGDEAPLQALLDLAVQYDAWLVVDDAHGLGVLGPNGRGSIADAGLPPHPNLIMIGTLGKAAGVSGAFVAGSLDLVEWLIQRARSYIYTTGPSPMIAGALLASLERILHGDDLRARLQEHIHRFRDGIAALKLPYTLLPSRTGIQALVIGDNAETLRISQQLLTQGYWVPAIRPPTVPVGAARLRISLSAAHTPDQIDGLITAIGATQA